MNQKLNTENNNKFDKIAAYNNCDKFYIGGTKIRSKISFNEH